MNKAKQRETSDEDVIRKEWLTTHFEQFDALLNDVEVTKDTEIIPQSFSML